MNFIIPELVREVAYRKGTYYLEEGDFASAGAFNFVMADRLERGFVTVEGGNFGYARFAFAQSVEIGARAAGNAKDGKSAFEPAPVGSLLYAFEAFHSDGPWDNPDDYQNSTAFCATARVMKARAGV